MMAPPSHRAWTGNFTLGPTNDCWALVGMVTGGIKWANWPLSRTGLGLLTQSGNSQENHSDRAKGDRGQWQGVWKPIPRLM